MAGMCCGQVQRVERSPGICQQQLPGDRRLSTKYFFEFRHFFLDSEGGVNSNLSFNISFLGGRLMAVIIIANIIDFAAAMVMIWSGTMKKKSKILAWQSVQLLMQTVSMTMLGGITGAISNVLSVIRNIICYKDKLTWYVKALLIAASLYLTIRFNTQGALGWLPFVVCTVYVLLMDIQNPIAFKLLVTASFVPWVVYYFLIRSYTGAFFSGAKAMRLRSVRRRPITRILLISSIWWKPAAPGDIQGF